MRALRLPEHTLGNVHTDYRCQTVKADIGSDDLSWPHRDAADSSERRNAEEDRGTAMRTRMEVSRAVGRVS